MEGEGARRRHAKRVRSHQGPQLGIGVGPSCREYHGLHRGRVAAELDGHEREPAVARQAVPVRWDDIPSSTNGENPRMPSERREGTSYFITDDRVRGGQRQVSEDEMKA